MDGNIAIIGAGEMACSYAKKARDIGVKTHCFAWEEGAIAKEYVDYFYPISIFEKDKITEICIDNQINGVVSTTELTIEICSYVQEKANLPISLDYIHARKITNKGWVRERSRNCSSIHHPLFKLVNNSEITWDRFPAIIKPASEGGKRGVIVVSNSTEFKNALEYALSFDRHNNGAIIEEYLDGGKEYSVETLSYGGTHNVVQITEKISSGPPHCVELGHHQPADLSVREKENVINAIKALLNSVSFKNGITHTEIKIIDGLVYLIELNARPGGDFISNVLTELSTGYDFFGEAIKVALGIIPAPAPKSSIRCAGIYFVTKQTEFLKPVFDTCETEAWCYKKHFESNELKELINNDNLHQNYIIYCSDHRIEFDNISKKD